MTTDNDPPLTAEDDWHAAFLGLQMRFMRILIELLIAKRAIEPAEAWALFHRLAEEMRTGADGATAATGSEGLTEVAYLFASHLEKMAELFGELDSSAPTGPAIPHP
jgi:hypothetical protein